jgi:hypothetical protein
MLTVNLPVYQSRIQVEKKRLLELFPRSLLSQALRDDPEALEITLENPLVTPEVIAVLNSVSPLEVPEGVVQAGIYLNIPFLEFMGTADYSFWKGSLSLPNKTEYTKALRMNIIHKLSFYQHYFDCILAGTYPDVDAELLQRTIYEGDTQLFDFVLKRVEPVYKNLIQALKGARLHTEEYFEFTRMTKGTDYKDETYQHIIKRLMACPSVVIPHPIEVILAAASTYDKTLVGWLLTQFKLTNDDYITFDGWLEDNRILPGIEEMIRKAF